MFDDFLFRDEDTVAKQFDEMNEFRTSVRGLKVRGVYDTRREAEVRAKVLQRKDQSFDVFVGQVGYWLPWDPEGNKLEDQEYLNNDLNKLVKEYKNNEAKKDMFYQEQKAERKKDAMTTSERLRKKLEALTEGVFLTRDLVSEPGNILHPDEYAKRISKKIFFIHDSFESYVQKIIDRIPA